MRALVADDDAMSALLVSRALEQWGFDVIVAHDGRRAWDVLQQNLDITVAVLDWSMPGIDGVELCRRIRQDESRPYRYALLLTARGSRDDLVTGLDAGADDYLIKPFDPEELRARVHVGMRTMRLYEHLTERVTELRDALARVHHLQGLLPICSYCKSVRSDDDYWEEVDEYIAGRADVQFTHGVCPECYAAVLKDLARKHASGAA